MRIRKRYTVSTGMVLITAVLAGTGWDIKRHWPSDLLAVNSDWLTLALALVRRSPWLSTLLIVLSILGLVAALLKFGDLLSDQPERLRR